MRQIDILEIAAEMFDDARIKNEYIKQTAGEYLGFVNQDVTSRCEVLELLGQYGLMEEHAAVVFGANVPEGQVCTAQILTHCDMDIYGVVFKRELLIQTGNFNEKLEGMGNLEFLCRLLECGAVCFVACDAEKVKTKASAGTIAYMLRRYMGDLQASGLLNSVFERVSFCVKKMGLESDFLQAMENILDDNETYYDLYRQTAPFFVLSGNDTCYGVLHDFADSLAKELAAMGQAVISTDGKYGYFESYETLQNHTLKGVIGFQAPVLEKDYFQNMGCDKFQFWFDNPIFFDDMLRGLSDKYHILCQDGFYADFIRGHYGTKNAIQFPPAGKDRGFICNSNRRLEVVFIGTYHQGSYCFEGAQQQFFEFMKEHPKLTFEQGLTEFLENAEVRCEEEDYLRLLDSMGNVCRAITNYFRGRVIETILSSGISLHVYGDSWKAYDGAGKEKLIIHPAVSVEESLEILGKTKIGLNVMTWHKAGMTERIANIMLSGAVCLSDETVYLREHFVEDEEIVLFELDKLNELPAKIERLLKDEEYRQGIAGKAYENASAHHTWRQRAEELLLLVNKG